MAKQVVLWTRDSCRLCKQVKQIFQNEGFEERDAEALIKGAAPDIEAMTQLAMQHMQLPIVMINGEFVDVAELLKTSSDEAA